MLANAIVELVKRAGFPLRILELGAGTGMLSKHVQELAPRARIQKTDFVANKRLGISKMDALLPKLSKKNPPHVVLMVNLLSALPVKGLETAKPKQNMTLIDTRVFPPKKIKITSRDQLTSFLHLGKQILDQLKEYPVKRKENQIIGVRQCLQSLYAQLPEESCVVIVDVGNTPQLTLSFGAISAYPVSFSHLKKITTSIGFQFFIADRPAGLTQFALLYKGKKDIKKIFFDTLGKLNPEHIESMKNLNDLEKQDYYYRDHIGAFQENIDDYGDVAISSYLQLGLQTQDETYFKKVLPYPAAALNLALLRGKKNDLKGYLHYLKLYCLNYPRIETLNLHLKTIETLNKEFFSLAE